MTLALFGGGGSRGSSCPSPEKKYIKWENLSFQMGQKIMINFCLPPLIKKVPASVMQLPLLV